MIKEPEHRRRVRFFEGQIQHVLFLALFVPGAWYLASPALEGNSFLGLSDATWFWAGIILATLHQVIIWFVFRTQLLFGLFTSLFGERDLTVWGFIFLPFLVLRPILTIGLGLADAGSLPALRWLQVIAGLALLVPVLYTGWSTNKYFGLKRAFGADHFREEYRKMEIASEGAFRFNSNAMYSFAFLLFWAIALLTGSWAALVSALFQHAYIWVHWYCTEQPDVQDIYGTM